MNSEIATPVVLPVAGGQVCTDIGIEYQFGGALNNLTQSGVRIVCPCVFVFVAALVSATSPLKVKARYQQKVLDAGNKMNVGIE